MVIIFFSFTKFQLTLGFANSIIYFKGGIYLMTLFDWYSAGYTPMLMALIELFVFNCIYGEYPASSGIKGVPDYLSSSSAEPELALLKMNL